MSKRLVYFDAYHRYVNAILFIIHADEEWQNIYNLGGDMVASVSELRDVLNDGLSRIDSIDDSAMEYICAGLKYGRQVLDGLNVISRGLFNHQLTAEEYKPIAAFLYNKQAVIVNKMRELIKGGHND